MWNLPGPGIEPMSPALADVSLTGGPSGKSFTVFIITLKILKAFWASLVAQLVKNSPVIWETWVQSLGWEDPLEKKKSTHSSILAWRIP